MQSIDAHTPHGTVEISEHEKERKMLSNMLKVVKNSFCNGQI